MSKQRETAILNTKDINTLFACRLYVGLGEPMGNVLQSNVRLSRKAWAGVKDNSVVRAEVIVDLSKVPATIKEDRLGSYGQTALSAIIFKLRKIPILGSQKLFFSIEGSPTVRERNFIFYDQPHIQIGQWQFTFKQISKFLNIHPPFFQEFLENEYGSLPMDPYSISVRKNSLDLQLNGSKTAW